MRISCSNRKVFSASILFMTVCFLADACVVLGSGGGITVMPDKSLFVQIANFLFLIWVLNIILYKPIRKILIQRKEKVTGLEQNIEHLDRDGQEKDEAYAAGLREARAKGFTEKEALLQTAAEEEKAVIDKINQKAQAELAQVREKIKKDAEAVRVALQREIDAFADAIGEKILGRTV